MKLWYDGYKLKGSGSVYNPNSVMQAIRNDSFDSYWTETSAASSLLGYISLDFDGLSQIIAELLGGIEVSVDTDYFANDLVTFRNKYDVLTLLIHLGYLAYDSETKKAHIPNEGIRLEFARSIRAVKRDEEKIMLTQKEQQTKTVASADLLKRQKAFFASGRTIPVKFRLEMLKKLYRAIRENHKHLTAALTTDLGKSESEGYMCEVGLVLGEISYQIRHLRRWAAPQIRCTELVNSFGRSFTIAEPLGNVLIMAPWNYPVLLSFEPLAGAIAAGNTVILKPSAYAPATSRAMAELIRRIFPPEYVSVVEGGRKENNDLLDLAFDHIFFTGSVAVGKTVMERAAKNLTPVTLELGGKSPVVVDHTADIPLAAKRIVFGKLLNCGQTCIAPDYILVERSVHDRLVLELKKAFMAQCPNPLSNPGYAHIVNQKHFERIMGLIDPEKVVYGGKSDDTRLCIEPTILDGVTGEDAVMSEEIFGPVLPVITVENRKEAENFICRRQKPLALYLFTRSRQTEERFLRYVPFGGGCINDTISHILSPRLPFGGTGNSGMGRYHGHASFQTFSNEKSVVKKYLHPDLPMRYTPYKKVYEKMIRLIQR